MSSNVVLKSVVIGTAFKAGRSIVLGSAIETQVWKRTEEIAKQAAEGLKDALEKDPNPLPENTAELVMRESKHPSDNDKRVHYTAVAKDSNGKYITTVHVPIEK
ncbi:hypothetical protein G7Y89_g3720 [Cudoniella acicularis]|uniref:Uncharacterized protein n=1 Tax=Cudoniella acicularis TaxID=354080 RepID=A0A8H4RTT5_9HELO|nr:hypothetical protein G7Y89_g3720 [Cudoniella acicularis]